MVYIMLAPTGNKALPSNTLHQCQSKAEAKLLLQYLCKRFPETYPDISPDGEEVITALGGIIWLLED